MGTAPPALGGGSAVFAGSKSQSESVSRDGGALGTSLGQLGSGRGMAGGWETPAWGVRRPLLGPEQARQRRGRPGRGVRYSLSQA